MADNAEGRRKSRLIESIIRPQVFLSNAFVEISGLKDAGVSCRVFVASPELCFLQAASQLSFLELIKLGYDLCAIYRFDETAEFQHRSRIPPLNVARLDEFLKRATGMQGVVKARRSLKYIRDRSNSPAETKLAIMQALPFDYGGFSINGQELNKEIILSEKAASVFRKRSLYCDTLWEQEKVIAEYDSNQTHLSVAQHDRDKRRSTALMIDGYRVFTVTSNMVSSIYEMEQTFIALRKMLGKRTDLSRIAATREKRRELVRLLGKM